MNINIEFFRATTQIARLDPKYVQAEKETDEIRASLPHRHENIPTPPEIEARLAELHDRNHERFMAARATLEIELPPHFKAMAREAPEDAKVALDQAVRVVTERHT
jgi:hypothetical protein